MSKASKSLLAVFPFTSKHENRRFWKPKLIDQQMFHALSVVDATFQLVAGVLVRYTDNHSLLTAVRVRRRAGWGVGIRRRLIRRRRRLRIRRRLGRRRRVARIGHVSDCLANSASDRRRTGRHLQRGVAIRAVDQHVHGDRDWGLGGRRRD